ncbi:MAG TPA: NAD-dependent epimerase/dehydratase family protein [Candidatus Acidoferrum sp.]|nr:NAD-dependent epimerase/dehydratase family protein [Candidatus Acidoferrum sp.]
MKRRALVTGGCGFVGSNVAAHLRQEGWQVSVLDNLSRPGGVDNLRWLLSSEGIEFVHGDTRNSGDVDRVIEQARPDAVFHLAGQVAMTTSMSDPRRDFETNALGSLNVLESIRRRKLPSAIVYASSNKVYGELNGLALQEERLRYTAPGLPQGVDETMPLDFQTPYGCSKGAADQYMLDYARSFGLNTVVFRHSTIFGGRQFATFDQGWVGWFCQQALAVKRDSGREPFTISGDGKQVRDLLFVDDAVKGYLAAVEQIESVRGQVFNLGGGMANSCSLLELFEHLERRLEVRLRYQRLPWRHSDQKFFVADISKARRLLHWEPQVGKEAGLEMMLKWVREADAGVPCPG